MFNKVENQDYVGALPDVSFYSPDKMSAKNRTVFLAWYEKESVKHEEFDFQKELLSYCVSDVDILRRCCILLGKLFMDVTRKDLDTEERTLIEDNDSDLADISYLF